MSFFDSHAHYNDEKFENDRKEILEKIYKEEITSVVCAGYNLMSSEMAIEIAKAYNDESLYPKIYSTCGISPNDIDDVNDIDKEILKMKNLIDENREIIKGIGEIGLDYYWNKKNAKKQQEIFINQIEFANEENLPIVIHTRDAVMDTLDIIKNKKRSKNTGIFHCCPLNIELIKEGVKLGYYISFSGNITFKNAKAYEVVKEVPIERILIETDSPYLAPEPYRGKRNNSEYVKLVAQKIAEIKNVSLDYVAEATYRNTKQIFRIK